MIKVVVSGFQGRMGAQVVAAVSDQDDMAVVGGFDPLLPTGFVELKGVTIAPAFDNLASALAATTPDVMVDFTSPNAVEDNLRTALAAGIDCVVGTTGLTPQKFEELATLAPEQTTLFHAPNFTLGAVLMMAFSQKAARYFPDAEVIEFHHNGKRDAPSGTAVTTALGIARTRREAGIANSAPGRETELPGREGARGALVEGVPVHAVRSNGFVAHQEVIFGSMGETLTLRHDSIDRAAYMPGILLAIREVGKTHGLIIGLDRLLDL
ncbi:MAG: 4-hydroxy-tetrahydrodipicolinate reductase [Coriobacteriales bacterium]|jgi:4-hydroxy-tetrahydrodipicolinate reductase|nr:4-hydroxy-tetrahydrodipicolinate reductase [Coriobacteriales bacterium]